MPRREVDQRKTRKALRKLRRAADSASVEEGGPGLTDWEKDFVEGVSTRLEKYGSAFRDPGKGRLEEALSNRQTQVTRVIAAKSRKAKAAAKTAATTEPGSKPDTRTQAAKDAPRRYSSFKPKAKTGSKPGAKPGWKPRSRDINADIEPPMPGPGEAPAPRLLKVVRAPRRG